jgi:hypothetical protein
MCHNLWLKHACGHKGSYLGYKYCKHHENTLEILAKVKTTNIELRVKMNERSCEMNLKPQMSFVGFAKQV